MNTESFERKLQQLDPPAADPEARLRARGAALAQFESMQARTRQPLASHRRWNGPWIGGLAAAGVASLAVAVFWRMPAQEREVAALRPAAQTLAAPPPATETSASDAQPPRGEAQSAAADADTVASVRMELPPAPSVARKTEAPAQQGLESRAVSAGEEVAATQSQSQALAISAPVTVEVFPPAPPPPPQVTRSATREEMRAGTNDSLSQVMVTGARIVSQPGGAAFVVLPPAATRGDQFENFETNAVKRTADEPVSTFSVDVDTTSYSFVRRMLNSGQLPPASAVRAEEMVNYFDYAWPAPQSRQQPFRPTVTVSDSPWGEGRKLVHVGIKGYELPARSQPDANLVLLIDVSGSMNSPDKLPLVKRSMKLLLDSLKPTDTVSIAVYAGAAGQVLPPTAVRDRETIEAALDGLRPGGSTAGAQGIRLAYDLAQRSFRNGGVNRILLATDGDFNVGVSDPQELQRLVERERGRGVYLSVLGFGQGNYRDDIAQALAQNGNGVAAYIDTLSEARKVLVREATSSLFTIAGDVKIQMEFNPATVAEYRLVGYETRALNREDFNNDKVDAGDVGSGRAVTAIYEITPVDSPARMIDAPRYGTAPAAASARGRSNEYGFVKIRYKLPGEEQSRLLEQPVRVDAGVPRALREDVAFSTAVAGFAQLLRGGRYTGALTYEDVLRQAASNRGRDPYGYRAEFLELVRRAQDSAAATEARE